MSILLLVAPLRANGRLVNCFSVGGVPPIVGHAIVEIPVQITLLIQEVLQDLRMHRVVEFVGLAVLGGTHTREQALIGVVEGLALLLQEGRWAGVYQGQVCERWLGFWHEEGDRGVHRVICVCERLLEIYARHRRIRVVVKLLSGPNVFVLVIQQLLGVLGLLFEEILSHVLSIEILHWRLPIPRTRRDYLLARLDIEDVWILNVWQGNVVHEDVRGLGPILMVAVPRNIYRVGAQFRIT